MKNIAKTLLFSAGLLTFGACSDFLDQTSPSEQTLTAVYESTYYTGLTINKIYGLLEQDQTYSQYIPIVWSTNSDCELIDGLGTDATNASNERGNMNYNSNPGWANIAKIWDAMYQIIEYANIAIDGIENSNLYQNGSKSEQTEMSRFLGEAYTLRAMVYFDLVRFFGDVPMKMEPSKSDLSNAYLEKTDRDEIMDQLIADLEKAADYLPWAGTAANYTTERVTKGYAHALLANIALTRAGWAIRETSKSGYETASVSDATYPTQRCDAATRQAMYEKALENLTAVINGGRHSLNPSFENEWYLINQRKLDETYRENIFEIPMGLGVTSELGYTIGVRINGASQMYGAKGNSSGKQKLTAPLFWSYDKMDLRRDITCANVQLKENNGVLEESMIGNTPFGIYVGKWDIRKMNEEWRASAIATGNAKWMSGINVVRMRYANVLLMYAEVLNELAGPDGSHAKASASLTARQALAQVHTRAFTDKVVSQAYVDAIPASKDAFFNAIVDENAWELAGEGFRKFDLVRWNLLGAKIDEMKKNYLDQLSEYPAKIYFNYTDASKTKIDMSSVTWYETPANTSDYAANASWFGTSNDTQIKTNLPSISSGLSPKNGETYAGYVLYDNGQNTSVVNRHLMPIASTTISNSNGKLHNSYGFSD